MTDEVYTCTYCKKAILDGESVHGAMWDHEALTGAHFDCVDASKTDFKNAMANAVAASERFKKTLAELREKLT